MKKKFLALFAACSMITTAAAGLVQTAYAADPNVRIEYTDGDTDTQKILNFYYEGVDALTAFGGTYSFSSNDVTVDSGSVTLTYNLGIKEFDTENCYISFSTFDDGGSSSADGLFATATITVPSDVDVTVELEVDSFTDAEENDYEDKIGTVSVTIPKKAAEPEEPEKTYYNKGYAFTSSADTVAKTYTKLTINVIDTANENKPGYAEVDLTDKLPTISGSGEFTLFIKNIPTAYEVTSVELD